MASLFARHDRSFKIKAQIVFAFIVSLVAVFIMLSPALGQTGVPNKKEGRELSKRFCINCHVVVPGAGISSTQSAPSFQAIAKHPEQSMERLAGTIIIPHPDMPAVSLTRYEIRDIVAYIMSLKPSDKSQ